MDQQSLTLKWTAIGGDVRLEIPRNHLDSHTIQITWIRCFSLYIYCTEILTGLLPFANKAIGSGTSAYYLYFVNIKTVRGCSNLTKITVSIASKLKRNCVRKVVRLEITLVNKACLESANLIGNIESLNKTRRK